MAVSSLAGTPLPMYAWGVDAVISASQKCLGGVPGLAVVAVNDRVWEIASAMPPSEVRSWYLHLTTWQKYEDESPNWHPYPATMPSPAMLGLHAALVALVAEGLDARLGRYRQRAARLRARLADLIRRLKGEVTVVVIEHDMEFVVGLADEISVIHWGQVIARGTPAALKTNPWVMASKLGSVA